MSEEWIDNNDGTWSLIEIYLSRSLDLTRAFGSFSTITEKRKRTLKTITDKEYFKRVLKGK